MINKFIKIFFSKKQAVIKEEVETSPLSNIMVGSVTPENTGANYRPQQWLVGCAQSIGEERDHNEDALFTFSSMISDEQGETPLGIFIVADGMGGHSHGEVASDAAVRAMSEHLITKVFLPMINSDMKEHSEPIKDILQDGLNKAQKAVVSRAPGGGTTLTTGILLGDQIMFIHVGDSRAYFIEQDNRLQVITKDHSLVQRLLDLEQISKEEASVHPQRNMLYQAIGQSEPYQPDIVTRQIPKPGHLLMCSDGLWGVVPEEEIIRIIRGFPNPSMACHEMVKSANIAGGPDNISVILVEFLV